MLLVKICPETFTRIDLAFKYTFQVISKEIFKFGTSEQQLALTGWLLRWLVVLLCECWLSGVTGVRSAGRRYQGDNVCRDHNGPRGRCNGCTAEWWQFRCQSNPRCEMLDICIHRTSGPMYQFQWVLVDYGETWR